MKVNENLNELSDAELILEHKKRKKNFTVIFIGVWTLIALSLLSFYFGGTNTFVVLIPLFFLPMVIKNRKAFTATREEVKKRQITL